MSAYKYSPDSTIHDPVEIREDGTAHTYTIRVNGENFHVTRELWEALGKDKDTLRADLAAAVEALKTSRIFIRFIADMMGKTTSASTHLVDIDAVLARLEGGDKMEAE